MPEKSFSNRRIALFIIVVSLTCASLLSLLATLLENPQKEAQEVYKSKQMLIAARILTSEGYFLVEGKPQGSKAKEGEILSFFNKRVHARLTDNTGKLYTFEELKIDPSEYIKNNEKLGYAALKYKLLYLIDGAKDQVYSYVIPINGYGLWDAIYGYLAIAANATTVLGTTWYDQKETPGLGAEIGSPEWQAQFYNKVIFQMNEQGETNYNRAPLGFIVTKTPVRELYGDRPISQSAIDGVTGASATMAGVTEAYRRCLSAYRPFLIKTHAEAAQ